MSTNFYAIVRLPVMHDEDEDSIFRFHIGKTGRGTSVNGNQFASFKAMVDYLRHTGAKIIDEYRDILTLEELVERFESYEPIQRRSQYDWVNKVAQDYADPQQWWAESHREEYWLDDEGYTICKGAFS